MKLGEKRRPLLADELLAMDITAGPTTRKWNEQTQFALRYAKKFVLDAQASKYLGEMIRDNPRIIADAQDFAIPPFNNMWVELQMHPFYRAVTGKEPDNQADDRIGYLFDGPLVKVGCGGWDNTYKRHGVGYVPVQYTLHRPMKHYEEVRVAQQIGTSRGGLDFWFWGESAREFNGGESIISHAQANEVHDEWDMQGLRALRLNHTVAVATMRPDVEELACGMITEGSSGDLRNIVALLLYLNRTHDVQLIAEFGPKAGFIKNKLRTYMAHHVISLKLDPRQRLKTLVAGSGIKHRYHDVRGHYCHDHKAKGGCQHGEYHQGFFGEWWTEYKPLKWKCSGCGGHRWWRKEHHRGSMDVGMNVVDEYAVTR